jgi:hypothetical protein
MKKSFGWGYAYSLFTYSTWIYIRPDIKIAINNEIISLQDVLKHSILNEHYFILEQTAINYLKDHCLRVLAVPIESDEEDSLSDNGVKFIFTIVINIF